MRRKIDNSQRGVTILPFQNWRKYEDAARRWSIWLVIKQDDGSWLRTQRLFGPLFGGAASAKAQEYAAQKGITYIPRDTAEITHRKQTPPWAKGKCNE